LVKPPGPIRTSIGLRTTGRFSRARVLAAYERKPQSVQCVCVTVDVSDDVEAVHGVD
jgi:hypothetical protein